jgi:mRNA interferase MazF
MTASAYLPDTGNLIWTDFDPTRGREQAGRRPALVVSPAAFTENTGLAIACPITSRVRPFPTSVVLPSSFPISGEILISHIRSIDAQVRPIRYAGLAVSDEIARLVRAKLNTFITI